MFAQRSLLIAFLILSSAVAALAQRSLDYDHVVVPQNRIDARALGYPPLDVIPDGESGITSLAVAPNGDIYGATSGARSHLFVLSPIHGFVQPIGYLPDTKSVTHAVVTSAEGDVYVGSGTSGHLLKYTPSNPYHQEIGTHDNKAVPVKDLGQAVEGQGIFTLAIDRDAGVIYGLTSPDTHFFAFSISMGKFSDWGVVCPKVPEGEKFEKDKIMSRMLALDAKGNVYASGEDGYLFKFDKAAQKLEKLKVQAPAIPGREPWTRVDAFMADAASGLIYGGTSDGYLFQFDPASQQVVNLGKPLIQYDIAGLAPGPGGKIYGVGGTDQGMARLFSYRPATGAYEELGFVDVNRRPYYTWQAYVIGAVAVGHRGTIYIGENERISKLYLFYPWE
jgi:outer membrane protein assembly factor BamB